MKTKWVNTTDVALLGTVTACGRVVASKPGAVLVVESDCKIDMSKMTLRNENLKNKNETPPARNLFSEN